MPYQLQSKNTYAAIVSIVQLSEHLSNCLKQCHNVTLLSFTRPLSATILRPLSLPAFHSTQPKLSTLLLSSISAHDISPAILRVVYLASVLLSGQKGWCCC